MNAVELYKNNEVKLTDEQITAYIDEFSAEYKEKNLGGDFGKNIRLNKKFERLTEDTLTLVNQLKICSGKIRI